MRQAITSLLDVHRLDEWSQHIWVCFHVHAAQILMGRGTVFRLDT